MACSFLSYGSQAGIRAYYSGNLYPSMQPTSICGLGTLCPDALFIGVHDVGISDTCPPSTMGRWQTTFPFFTPV